MKNKEAFEYLDDKIEKMNLHYPGDDAYYTERIYDGSILPVLEIISELLGKIPKWNKIDEEDPSTLPEPGKEVIIVSEEGRYEVQRRHKNQDFIYSHQTDSGVATKWMELP